MREYKISSPDHLSPKPFKRRRSYRIDFAWPQYMIAVEWDGAIFKGWRGAHTSPKTFASDRIKDVLLQEAGWLVMRFNVIHKRDGLIGPLMMMAFVARGWGRDAATD